MTKLDPNAIRERVKSAFKALRRDGYITRMNFMCCQTCAYAEIRDHLEKKDLPLEDARCVFYHRQDSTDLRNGEPFYLAWTGDPAHIVQRLKEAGLDVTHDDPRTRIRVNGLTT